MPFRGDDKTEARIKLSSDDHFRSERLQWLGRP